MGITTDSDHTARTVTHTLMHTFRAHRFGNGDPCVRIDVADGLPRLTFASQTIEGPAWVSAIGTAQPVFGGPGSAALARRALDPAGNLDRFEHLEPAHPIVARLQRDFGAVRMGATGDTYKAALTATLGQRITAAEAVRQWYRLCRTLGEPIDTPAGQLVAPPPPTALADLRPYQLHTHGIEESRATTLIAIARVFMRTGQHHDNPCVALSRLSIEVPRFGPWTGSLVATEALGDPDAVPVGDFHVKNVVAHALRNRPRGTDDEMLETLAPYTGQRGRVIMWLGLAGITAPKFGPRRTNPDIRSL